ncbi:peroxide/acid stress response protein YhcN [Martelella alba]|uniref:Peroxide/acid stress response protein YhcN n=1 Tax=Martelella alba TaxID=2590451 RepID=A0ABY2SQT4_9HYPH|nr:peroxide/acid stress response protein YhcN [Martelella alba]TKI08579.1 peroxide/acid stress response protein YhcN [Martelella alba]
MKVKTAVSLMGVLSALSFGSFAAESINLDQSASLQPMGSVSVSGTDASPADMHQALNQAADAQGAAAYRVVEAHDGDYWHATAELYK